MDDGLTPRAEQPVERTEVNPAQCASPHLDTQGILSPHCAMFRMTPTTHRLIRCAGTTGSVSVARSECCASPCVRTSRSKRCAPSTPPAHTLLVVPRQDCCVAPFAVPARVTAPARAEPRTRPQGALRQRGRRRAGVLQISHIESACSHQALTQQVICACVCTRQPPARASPRGVRAVRGARGHQLHGHSPAQRGVPARHYFGLPLQRRQAASAARRKVCMYPVSCVLICVCEPLDEVR